MLVFFAQCAENKVVKGCGEDGTCSGKNRVFYSGLEYCCGKAIGFFFFLNPSACLGRGAGEGLDQGLGMGGQRGCPKEHKI